MRSSAICGIEEVDADAEETPEGLHLLWVKFRGFKSLRDPSRKIHLEKSSGGQVSKLNKVLSASSYGIFGFYDVSIRDISLMYVV